MEISPLAMRRARIRDSLPTEHPKLLDEMGELTAELPDPSELSLEELAGSLGVAGRLVNQLEAWLTAVAAEADTRKASQVLCAGTTGTMVAAALERPHVLFRQLRAWQALSAPGQSAGALHATHRPPPLHTLPPLKLQAAPEAA